MKCIKGTELRDYCKAWLEERNITTPRDIANKFHATCLKNDLRVVLLVGLKGTGKTTLMKDFIPSSSRFSDVFIWSRYIFSGTGSFSMTLAMEDELFDRAHAFHMLPLFYPEAHRVFHQDFDTYLRYGGRIEGGEAIYESMESFREARD